MQHMKHIYISILILLLGTLAYGQADRYYQAPSDTSTLDVPAENGNTEASSAFTNDRLSLHPQLNIGSSISSFGGTPMMNSYFAPSVRIQPPGKFSMTVGTSFSYGNMMSMSLPESQSDSYFEKMATYQMYASGAYQVNQNLNIRGGASMTFIPGRENEPLKRGHFGFDYKIGEKTHISADFNFGDAMPYNQYMYGRNPYSFGNGYMPGFYGSHPFMY